MYVCLCEDVGSPGAGVIGGCGCLMSVLGIELGSPGKAACAQLSITPNPQISIFKIRCSSIAKSKDLLVWCLLYVLRNNNRKILKPFQKK